MKIIGIIPARMLNDPTYQRYIDSINDSDLVSQIPRATADTYIATEHILLMATALGLGSCWVGGISDHKAVRNLFGIPRGIIVLGIIAIGYTNIEPKPRPRLPLEKILLRPFPTSSDTK